jgi:pyruvate dehydrogenase E2 component (dihydrolipoamide acetyltransferase)
MGFETPEEGYLAKIIMPAGEKNVPVGRLVCIIVPDEGSIAAFKDFKDDGSLAAPPPPPIVMPTSPSPAPAKPPPAAAPAAPASASFTAPQGNRIFASPLARRLAAEQGLDLQVSSCQTYPSLD